MDAGRSQLIIDAGHVLNDVTWDCKLPGIEEPAGELRVAVRQEELQTRKGVDS
jgi:hypothetical protein